MSLLRVRSDADGRVVHRRANTVTGTATATATVTVAATTTTTAAAAEPADPAEGHDARAVASDHAGVHAGARCAVQLLSRAGRTRRPQRHGGRREADQARGAADDGARARHQPEAAGRGEQARRGGDPPG